MASWSSGTQSRYKPHIQRWFDFCSAQNIDPISPPVEAGAEFLTGLFNSGVGYSVINTARSALSSIIQMPNGVSFGKLPLITRLLKGMFKIKPSLLRYTVTYDVSIVLKGATAYPSNISERPNLQDFNSFEFP